ncbi:hypothetical protein GJ744_005944 [Endocarpon pusillum]|uniref:Uncharacterized protein n=1 Tax=Endocarpon pusillum TaxID=364733 RepID=A0A8H7ANW9_9EURO|nr:hypothetical protein GJ744_005944 [Endocarpon pusillum]
MEYMATVDTKCLSAKEYKSLGNAGYQLSPDTRWVAYNMTFDPKAPIPSDAQFPESMLVHGCLYGIQAFFDRGLLLHLAATFSGTVSGSLWTEHPFLVASYTGPQNLQRIYNYGNVSFERISRVFGNISDSLTNYIRQNGDVNHSAPAFGVVMRDQTCLQVRWGWLAFPAGLVLITLIFFAALVIDTRPTGTRAQVWKSSPLGLMFHGLKQPAKYLVHRQEGHDHNMNDIAGMESVAKGMIVRLEASEKGVNLLEIEEDERVSRK